MSEPAHAERRQTPSQTVGPFFGYALPYAGGGDLVDRSHPQAVRLHGRVYDGNGAGVPDALVELWQPDESGRISTERGSRHRDGYVFTGFGRAATDRAGDYSFTTVVPGAAEGRAPYALVALFARGLLHHLFTRAYFIDPAQLDAVASGDAVLSTVAGDRRRSLIAMADAPRSYRFDIRLQGAGETVFLDFDD